MESFNDTFLDYLCSSLDFNMFEFNRCVVRHCFGRAFNQINRLTAGTSPSTRLHSHRLYIFGRSYFDIFGRELIYGHNC